MSRPLKSGVPERMFCVIMSFHQGRIASDPVKRSVTHSIISLWPYNGCSLGHPSESGVSERMFCVIMSFHQGKIASDPVKKCATHLLSLMELNKVVFLPLSYLFCIFLLCW